MKKQLLLLLVFFIFFVGGIFSGNPTVAPAMAQAGTTLEGCPIFPADNIWNTSIENLPVDPNSSAYISTIGATKSCPRILDRAHGMAAQSEYPIRSLTERSPK